MYLFGIMKKKPSREIVRKIEIICNQISREEGRKVRFIEVNRKEGAAPEINHGHYMCWFEVKSLGSPFDKKIRKKVMTRMIYEIW